MMYTFFIKSWNDSAINGNDYYVSKLRVFAKNNKVAYQKASNIVDKWNRRENKSWNTDRTHWKIVDKKEVFLLTPKQDRLKIFVSQYWILILVIILLVIVLIWH